MNMNKKAEEIARKAHENQKRWGGEPYIIHPKRIVEQLKYEGYGAFYIQAAWLHDVVEDTEVTLEQLEKEGFDSEVISALDYLTHKNGMSYRQYITDIVCGTSDIARVVKLRDLEDNLADMDLNRYPQAKQRNDKYELAHFIIETWG